MAKNGSFRNKVKGMLSPNERFKRRIETNADKILSTVQHAYDKDVKFLPKNFMPKLDNALHTRNVLEYSVWYSGKQEQLKRFYREAIRSIEGGELFRESTSFWKDNREDEDYIFVHSGLPQSITQAMVDIETLAGLNYEINHIDNREDPVYDRLYKILKNSKFNTEKWQEGTALKSVFGGTCYRPIINRNIADTPILEVVQPEQFRLKIENGYTTGFTFVDTQKKKDKNGADVYTELLEHNDLVDGDIVISYEVLEWRQGKDEPISIELKDFFKEDAKFYEPVVIEGFGSVLPVYIKNKSSNSEFRGSQYGESDYSNNIDLFHAHDQANSSVINQLADAQLKTLVNENLIDKTLNGDWSNWKKWKRSFTITKGDLNELGNTNMIDHSQANVDWESHLKVSDMIIQEILANVGLAPETLGISGAAPDASGKAIRERENVTLRTREKKLKLQGVGLSKLFENMLKLDDYMNGQPIGDYHVDVTFSSFTQHSLDEKFDLASKAAGSPLDDKTILELVFSEEFDDEKIEVILERLEEQETKFLNRNGKPQEDPIKPEGEEGSEDGEGGLSHAELKARAKERGIKEYWLMTKEQLRAALGV